MKKITYASYPNRIKALITDLFMINVPVLFITTYIFMDGPDDFQSSQTAILLSGLVLALIYSIFLAKTGQTPGKKAYEIQVVDSKTYHKIMIFRALWRYFAFLISATTLFGLLLPLVRKDNKSLHDLLSGTVVREI